MMKQNRKRRHENVSTNAENEVDPPRNKFRSTRDGLQGAEEEQLTKILFGGASTFLQSLEEAEKEAALSNIDSGVGEDDSDDSAIREKAPAWFDDDDDGIEVGSALDMQGRTLPPGGINERTNKYSHLLQTKFTGIVGRPNWAELKRNHEADLDDEILRSCGFTRKTSRASLPQNVVEIKKVKDLNYESYNEGPYVNAVEFHPTSSVGLVAGNNGVATLYAVDGKSNNKLHSVAFENFSITCAKFLQNGNEALLGSRRSYVYSYDLMAAKPIRIPLPTGMTQFKNFLVSPDSKFIAVAGKWGEVHILTASSKERIATLKQDSEVTAMAYNTEGSVLYGHSDRGEITIWDMKMNRVCHKFMDEGCLQGTTLTISPSNQFLAAGSAQGVVNLYGIRDVRSSTQPKPTKTILNLTTSISDLKFNPSSEVLAFSSSETHNSVKLFHVASGTVFSNFPSFEAKLGQINVINFSPGSGYIAFGNRKNTVPLYRLKHYKSY